MDHEKLSLTVVKSRFRSLLFTDLADRSNFFRIVHAILRVKITLLVYNFQHNLLLRRV